MDLQSVGPLYEFSWVERCFLKKEKLISWLNDPKGIKKELQFFGMIVSSYSQYWWTKVPKIG